MMLSSKQILLLLLTAGCSSPETVLPWSVQKESSGVTYRVDAVRVDHSKPKVYPRCLGTCQTKYDGRFELTVHTSQPFGPVTDVSLERGPWVDWFGISCQVVPVLEAGVTSIDFVCPFPTAVNGWVAGREQRLGLGANFPGLESPSAFEFEGATYDPETFPAYTE